MIEGCRIRLRAPNEGDLPALAHLRNDVQLQTQLLCTPRPNTTESVRSWLDRRLQDPQALLFVIAEQGHDGCVGFLQAVNMNLLHGTAWLGVALVPEAQGRGYGREAVELCEQYTQARFRLRKMLLEVRHDNERALRLYKALGYRAVGTCQQHFYADGRFHDVTIMEKLLVAEAAVSTHDDKRAAA